MQLSPNQTGFIPNTILALLFLLLALPVFSHAQEEEPDPVTWTFTTKKLRKDLYEIQLIARVDSGWRIYTQYGVYFPTVIKINTHPQVTPKGKIIEAGKLVISADKFDKGAKYLKGLVNFKQPVFIKTGAPITVTGYVRYAATDGKVMLQNKMVEFSIRLSNK